MNRKTQTFTKINTLYRRYANLKNYDLPNKAWMGFQNKIILGSYSDDVIPYIKNLQFDCFSKIDGTNSKIVYFPSTGECFCGGKTDNADIVGTGQKAFLDEVIERIKPILAEMFPPESAKFAPVMNDKNQPVAYRLDEENKFQATLTGTYDKVGNFVIPIEEVPVYIYGEFFGKKVQAGGNYDKEKNRFSVFDICQQGWFVPIDILFDYCERLGLDVVPYLGKATIPEAEDMVREGFKTHVPDAANPDYLEEGIVARPVVPIKDTRGKRIIVKIKTCDYKELQAAIDRVGIGEYYKFRAWYNDNVEKIC